MATRYNYLVIGVKTATFVPLAAVIYFTEYSKWVNYFFSSSSDPVAGFIVASFVLFALGVILKRRIVATYLQLSKNNIILGSIALTFTAGLYIGGTLYYNSDPVPPYESLIAFAASYVLLRSDTRLMRLLWPLFVLLGVVPLSTLLVGPVGYPISGAMITLAMFGLFEAFLSKSIENTKENLRLLGLPALVIILSSCYWFLSLGTTTLLIILVLIPGSLLLLLVPKLGRKLQFSRVLLPAVCPGHKDTIGNGFCSICGKKFVSSKNVTSSGLVGLAIAIILLGVLLTTQIPLLTLGASPHITTFSYSGVATSVIPSAPSGWLVNGSTVLNESGDLYAIKQVYVPAYHPEVKNYTLYFALASNHPATVALGDIPGFGRGSQDLSLDGYSGELITYNASNSAIVAFTGETSFTFASGSKFLVLDEAVTYIRNFTGVNSTAADSQVVSDLNSIFLPVLQSQNTPQSWADFFDRASATMNALSGILVLILTSSCIFAVTFVLKQSDYKVDTLETRSSNLDDNEWQVLSSILARGRPLTTLEIGARKSRGDKQRDLWRDLEQILRNLDEKHLVRSTLFERGSETFSGWQVGP